MVLGIRTPKEFDDTADTTTPEQLAAAKALRSQLVSKGLTYEGKDNLLRQEQEPVELIAGASSAPSWLDGSRDRLGAIVG